MPTPDHQTGAVEILPPETAPLATRPNPGALLEIDVGAPWKTVFEVWARGADHSPHTLKAYRRHLGRFFEWAGIATPTLITPGMLSAWRAELRERCATDSSFAQAVAALRTLIRFCRGFDGGKYLPDMETLAVVFKSPKVDNQRHPQILQQDEIDSLLRVSMAPEWHYTDSMGRARRWKRSEEIRARDHALIRFMLGTGARVAEAVALAVRDLAERPSGGLDAYIARGKGKKARTVYAPADASDAMRRYLHTTDRRLGGEGWLFPSPGSGGNLTTRAVEKILERLMKRAEIHAKRITPHSLRHTFADRFLRSTGGDVVRLQQILGHTNVKTTQRYLTKIKGEEVAESVPLVSVAV